jgi:aminoglycoside phosphotransferase family enzyme
LPLAVFPHFSFSLAEKSTMDDQREVIRFLSNAASYGKAGEIVERIETHISIVFLVGDRAYKLKRAVCLSYLDFSTCSLRERFCRAELALNRRTAAALYLRVRAVTGGADGHLAFDGGGMILDWVLEMKRFSQNDLFDHLAESRKLTAELMRDLTDVICSFHAGAEIMPGHGGRAGIEAIIASNNLNLVQSFPPLDAGQVQELYATSMAELSAIGGLLDARRDGGSVRRCHGDLHLGNICLFENRPTPFDCIEFSESLSSIDVFYDLAFLLMDLVERDFRDLANIVFNRYLDLTDNLDGLSALPLFMSVRAAVRAHVLVALNKRMPAAQTLRRARSYLGLAGALLRPHSPRLIAIGGLSGAGKSTIAQALASAFAPAPGARVARSDVLRKRLFNVMPETRLPPSAYAPAITERVYRGLHDQALASVSPGARAKTHCCLRRPRWCALHWNLARSAPRSPSCAHRGPSARRIGC